MSQEKGTNGLTPVSLEAVPNQLSQLFGQDFHLVAASLAGDFRWGLSLCEHRRATLPEHFHFTTVPFDFQTGSRATFFGWHGRLIAHAMDLQPIYENKVKLNPMQRVAGADPPVGPT